MEDNILNNNDKEENENQENESTLKKVLKEIADWVICFIIAYALYLILNYFIGTISGVKQVSMLPTAKEGERLVIQRTVVFKRDLQYGDIITFEAPLSSSDKYTIYESDDKIISDCVAKYHEYKGFDKFLHDFVGINKVSYIKRVIGLPGDHIYVSKDGNVFRNGEKIDEPYTKDDVTSRSGTYINIEVPEDTVFVMGDNRLESKDSRVFGCIPISKVNGYVICRVWPFNKIGKLNKTN